MRNLFVFSFLLLISTLTFADTGALKDVDVSTELVGIRFENNEKTLVLTFGDQIDGSMHCIIDIRRINDLEYKTRVMRYFGGLLVNETHRFKDLVIVIAGKRMNYDWNRDNVSVVVNKMVRQASLMI